MSYDIIAKSVDDARPIELYQISYSGNRWYYTSADREMTVDGITYVPAVVDHDSIDQAADVFTNGLTVKFERNVAFASLFNPAPPSEIVYITILAANYLVDGEYIVFWKGKILNVEWSGAWIELTTQSNYSSLQQQGLRRRYSRNCPFALYGAACKASANAHRDDTSVIGIDGLYVTLSAAIGKPDDYYAGGYITWINNAQGNQEKRMVRNSAGSTGRLYLSSFPIDLANGDPVSAYAGCDHTIATCESKFDNEKNYGGTPYIPTKNPFNGSSVY